MSIATILLAAAAETEHSGNVAMETIVFGIIALAVFGALALVTFSYRDVANRHAAKGDAYAASHGTEVERGAGHGH